MPGKEVAFMLFITGWTAILPFRANAADPVKETPTEWPSVVREMRPWTRWWWLGSAVDEKNISLLLEEYNKAGLGGVEITPIYGVQGQEAREIPYLSPRWVQILKYTISQAHRLDMGVDMPTGTGWPFGGPNVSAKDAEDKLDLRSQILTGGMILQEEFGSDPPQALIAISDRGETVRLLEKIGTDGKLMWPVPPGTWKIYRVGVQWSRMNVKRAAPGGQGKCINPFSKQSVTDYLQLFDRALADLPAGSLRCQFHDSFEYAANWSPDFFKEFQSRRGYDLQDHLPALAKDADAEEVARVRTDCRETLADLLLENFMGTWTNWAHSKGNLTRDQAHGSPGNLLDLYGAADIPETEIFHKHGDVRLSKFASSAAHVLGRNLASSESGTWLGEHFTVTLAQTKALLDTLMVSGINHIFYHGTAYSPQDAKWPGWLFYAASHYEPNNPIWHDFPALNAYVTRCQSILQSGQPDEDVLLYWPLHDLWQKTDHFGLTIEGNWFQEATVGSAAQYLWEKGYGYDYISDRQISLAKVEDHRIRMPGGFYKTILIPPCTYMPLPTLEQLVKLSEQGANILFLDHLPTDVPGLGNLADRRKSFKALLDKLSWQKSATSGMQAVCGNGKIFLDRNPEALLSHSDVLRETLVDHKGMAFLRRSFPGGHYYFLINQGKDAMQGWVALSVPAKTVVFMDPMFGKTGVGRLRSDKSRTSVFLSLQPGESIILRALEAEATAQSKWLYPEPSGEALLLKGRWKVTFLQGGPELPKEYETNALASWTKVGSVQAERFSGTARYTLVFNAPLFSSDFWMLDLGNVFESARVHLNGKEIGTLIGPPYRILLPSLKPVGNVLDVDVTNLAANRIRDMDRRKEVWRIFHEINFVNIDYKLFDASEWPVRDSGLVGPVRLIPISRESALYERP